MSARIGNARDTWNAPPPPVFYSYRGYDTQYAAQCTGVPRNRNKIKMTPLDGSFGVLGETRYCFANGKLDRFSIHIDTDEEWYTGTALASQMPPLTFDWWSLITHELGHGLGFGSLQGEGFPGHFTDSTACPADVNLYNTMCQGQSQEQTFWRTLGTHDIHTFDARY